MSAEERRFSELLHQVAPDPEVAVSFEDLAEVRRRRRRTSALLAAAAVVLVAIAVPVAWQAFSSGDEGRTGVLKPSPSPTPTVATDGRCPPTEPLPGGQVVMVDYVDFVQLDGRQYVAQMPEQRMPAYELGFPVGEVTCEIRTLTEAGDRRVAGGFLDGNAAYLPVGTALQAVSGYEASCRVAALVDGEPRVYLAQQEGSDVSTPRACALAPSADAPTVTRCDAVPQVPDGEITTNVDVEHKVLQYSSGSDNTTLTINYGADPTCRARADVRRLVDHALATAAAG